MKLLLCALMLACLALRASAALAVYDLRCDYAENPCGIDSAPPRLAWKLRSDARGARQAAWQVLVASTPEILASDRGDVWDSGVMKNDAQSGVAFAGRALRSSENVFWKVRAWDGDGAASAWSEPATWTMGVLAPDDWHAHWITPAEAPKENSTLLLRREFHVRPGLRRALVHASGVGAYELMLNGNKVGDELLAPGWTTYEKTVVYATHDVTALLHSGANAAGIFLGNGMYSVQRIPERFAKFANAYRPPFALAVLRLEYADGSVDFVGTDASWRTHAGPATIAQVYSGEDYDARLEPSGWDRAGFDDREWTPAKIGAGPGGKLFGASHAAPPVRAHETFHPIAVKSIRPGVEVCDLGQNAAFMPRLRVRGAAGSSVTIIPAELVKPDGTVDRGSVGGSRGLAWWRYTLRGPAGGEAEAWFPKFFYHGCRYLQVERRATNEGGELPTIESLEGVVVHSASPAVGEFACSDELFNRIRALVRWAQRSNLMSVLTDCPHRERLGWLEQYHLNGPALRYEFDLTRLYAKTFRDMADAQTADGLVPDIAPEYVAFKGSFRDSPEWGSAFILAAWQHHVFTGDDAPLREHFDAMRRYVRYLAATAKDGLVDHGLGDWFDLGPGKLGASQLTPIALTATAFYFDDAQTLAAIARIIGRADDATQLAHEAGEIKTRFNEKFFRADAGGYATGSQTANAVPLVMQLVAPADRSRVVDALVRDVRAQGLTAGDVGYRYLLRALADGGRSDVIFELNHQSDRPGYGFQLAHGATSLTEAWDASRGHSQDHFMLGQITEWFYHDLAGLAPDPEAPGFKHLIIRPQPVGTITWARAEHESPRGKIAVAWKRDAQSFTLEAEIPVNTTATVYLPAARGAEITESGSPIAGARGVRRLHDEDGAAVFAVESGKYAFAARTK